MSGDHHFINLTPKLTRALIAEMQAVLDGEAAYFHAELWTDAGLQVGLHLSGPDDALDAGGSCGFGNAGTGAQVDSTGAACSPKRASASGPSVGSAGA